MTAQEVFDKVAVHLLTQGKRSVSDADPTHCMYRGKDGRRCSIGALIPDDKYDADMEFLPVGVLKRRYPGLLPALPNEYRRMLPALQNIHDILDVDDWGASLEDVARQFKLDPSAVTNFKNSNTKGEGR